ncbi:MAG: hypothetical protein HY287_07140 [Planctomycetes bacterium]|nr:hypothetical protein [Planctomycetota bacterium]
MRLEWSKVQRSKGRIIWPTGLGTIGSIGLLFVCVAHAQTTAPAPSSASPDVERILTDLQKRSDDLHDIRCEVRFIEDDQINMTKKTKTGRIMFAMTQPNPKFLIQFDKTAADGVVGKREWYLFDGQWLYQAVERTAQVTKQELANRDQKLDLFDLEKAPFPLPFGQKKEAILRNFEVELVPPTESDPANTDHLRCKTKPGSKLARRYQQLDLYVHRTLHLPTRIVVTKSEGQEINTAEFPDLSESSVNVGVKPGDLDRPAEWKGYKEVVEELLKDEK